VFDRTRHASQVGIGIHLIRKYISIIKVIQVDDSNNCIFHEKPTFNLPVT